MPNVLRLAATGLLACVLLHCAALEAPAPPVEEYEGAGALVGTPHPDVVALLIDARARSLTSSRLRVRRPTTTTSPNGLGRGDVPRAE